MIRLCDFDDADDLETIFTIINDAADAYRPVIAPERWTVPFISRIELQHEASEGVVFWGYEEIRTLLAVLGVEDILDVTLVRHIYVRKGYQNRGIGSELMAHLRQGTSRPLLAATFAEAAGAIRFYERHGFLPVTSEQKEILVKKYWQVSDRRIEGYVVLADMKARDILL
jgi:GNAT superfamily N-acetyltransferase